MVPTRISAVLILVLNIGSDSGREEGTSVNSFTMVLPSGNSGTTFAFEDHQAPHKAWVSVHWESTSEIKDQLEFPELPLGYCG